MSQTPHRRSNADAPDAEATVEVSVVVPTYDRAGTLPRALDSALAQTHDDFEVVVVDDGSTDDTESVVRSYDDGRVRYLGHDRNRGQNAARNTGLRAATGRYVSYLDSDDELLPGHLERAVGTLRDLPASVAGVLTGYEQYSTDGESAPRPVYDGRFTLEDLATDMYVKIGGFTGLTFARRALDVVGDHDESVTNKADLDFYLQLLEQFDLYGIDEVLYRAYRQPDSVSTDARLVAEGERRLLERHGHRLSGHRRAMRRFNRGVALAELGEMRAAAGAFLRCIADDPRAKSYYYHFAIALLGQRLFRRLALYRRRREWYPTTSGYR